MEVINLLTANAYMPMPFGSYIGIPLIDIVRKGKAERKYIQGIRDTTKNKFLSDSIHKAIILFIQEAQKIKNGYNIREEKTKA